MADEKKWWGFQTETGEGFCGYGTAEQARQCAEHFADAEDHEYRWREITDTEELARLDGFEIDAIDLGESLQAIAAEAGRG